MPRTRWWRGCIGRREGLEDAITGWYGRARTWRPARLRSRTSLRLLRLPREHAALLVPDDNGVLEPHVPSMRALQLIREAARDSLAARTRAHTPLAGAWEVVPQGAVHQGPGHRDMLCARDGRRGATRASAVPHGARPAATSSGGGRQGWASGRAQASTHPLPSTGAAGPPPSGEPGLADDPDPAVMP